jgi:cytochrome c-type biogenesis protein CcsB
MDIQSILDNLIFANLLVVTIIYWASLIFSNFKILPKLAFYGNICASGCLFILLGSRWLTFGYFPLSNLYESLMFLAWGITTLVSFIENRSKISLIGSISTPIALFVTGFASLSLPDVMQAPSPLVPALKSNWLMMHVTVMMLSYASLLVGSLLSIFFLVLAKSRGETISIQGNSYGTQSTKVTNFVTDTAFYKTSNIGNYSTLILNEDTTEKKTLINTRLNLLESIDNLSYRTISFGFPLLTIGIIAGAVWANEAWGSYWSWDPKETWALITWLVFASYLHARITKSWQGEKPAIIASFGFIVVWICYLGVNFLGKGLHTYGQIL